MDQLVVVSIQDLRDLIREEIKQALAENNPDKGKSIKPMTTKETCKFLDIDISTLNRWKKENNIPYMKKGKRIYYDQEEIINSMKHFSPGRYNKLKAYN